MIFVDGIRTLDDLKNYASRLASLPLLYNGALLPIAEIGRYGFKLNIHTSSLMAAYVHFRDSLRELKETGKLDLPITGHLFAELVELMGVPETEALSKKYTN